MTAALLLVFGALLCGAGFARSLWFPATSPSTATAGASAPTQRIADIRVGQRTVGRNPLRDEVGQPEPDPDPATWRKVVLRLEKDGGGVMRVELLRPVEWLEEMEALTGGEIFLELPEMGAVGDADVIAVLSCPPIEPGRGNVVTGTFHHEADAAAKILTVRFSNDAVVEGVTDNHPFWSVDQEAFLPIGELHEGDLVQANSGLYGRRSVTSTTRGSARRVSTRAAKASLIIERIHERCQK